MAKRKSTDTVSFTLRMREELRAELEGAAKGKEVSLNQEIVERLKTALTDRVIEANQNLIVAQLNELTARLKEQTATLNLIDIRLKAAEAELTSVNELSEGTYQELTRELRALRSAIERGGVNLDPEDRK